MFTIELNNARKDADFVDKRLNEKSPVVEIFNAIISGNDLSKFEGKKVDAVAKKVQELCERASKGDYAAKAEMNEIVRLTIEPQLKKEMQVFSFLGRYVDLTYDQQAKIRTYKHSSIRSNIQAAQGDVNFGTIEWTEYPVNTQTISSGLAVNYREAAANLDRIAEAKSQVQVDIRNKALAYAVTQLYNGIKNATGIKYFAENNGIQQASLDQNLKKVRRFGRPSIAGDYSVVSQLNDFTGFKADPSDSTATGLSQMVMDEIMKTGLLSNYKGNAVVELPNQYDLTTKNTAGDNFKTQLPEGLLFLIPNNQLAPFQMFRRGGLTSMTGNDVVSGTEITRFDLEFGASVVKGREYEIGLISDTAFDAPSY